MNDTQRLGGQGHILRSSILACATACRQTDRHRSEGLGGQDARLVGRQTWFDLALEVEEEED